MKNLKAVSLVTQNILFILYIPLAFFLMNCALSVLLETLPRTA